MTNPKNDSTPKYTDQSKRVGTQSEPGKSGSPDAQGKTQKDNETNR